MTKASAEKAAPASELEVPACAHCHAPLRACYLPSQEEYDRAFDRENPTTLPFGSDTMAPKQREKFGNLYLCTNCGAPFRLGGTGAGSSGGSES